ncbi:MAG: DUF3077 domain-containing protein [Pseudomonas sp.]|uniref:DUF3077 domain-containing protein n=1 Tax=Pseudomonas sp. TaxID=306 RepID=UPI003D11DA08
MKDSCTPHPSAHSAREAMCSAAVTTHIPFHTGSIAGQSLFAVQPGVPLAAALNSAYCLLDVAQGLTLRLNESGAPDNEQIGHACTYLVEMAKATVRSCIEGVEREIRHDPMRE